QRELVRFPGGEQPFRFIVGSDEGVDRVRGTGGTRGNGWLYYGLQRPQPCGPLVELFFYGFFWSVGSVQGAQRDENHARQEKTRKELVSSHVRSPAGRDKTFLLLI